MWVISIAEKLSYNAEVLGCAALQLKAKSFRLSETVLFTGGRSMCRKSQSKHDVARFKEQWYNSSNKHLSYQNSYINPIGTSLPPPNHTYPGHSQVAKITYE